MKKLIDILVRLLIVVILLLFTIWQTALYLIQLVGAILYNVGDFVPFEQISWKETKTVLKDLRIFPSDTYELLINILKGVRK